MSNEMGCYVTSMPIVMKFGTTDQGMLYKQFCCVFQLTGGIEGKLIEG